jgi:hypothetical protein
MTDPAINPFLGDTAMGADLRRQLPKIGCFGFPFAALNMEGDPGERRKCGAYN